MKNWKKLISAGLALGLVLTSVPQSTSVVYAQENGTLQKCYFRAGAGSSAECTDYSTEGEWTF